MQFFLLFLVIAGAFAGPAQLPASPAFIGGYIIGGQEVDPIGKYPWMGTLEIASSHACGCVYIGQNLVLTAAHCTDGRAPTQLHVLLGVHHRTNSSQGQPEYFEVLEKIEHSDYGSQAPFPNDMCILKLEGTRSEGNEFIAPIPLASDDNDFVDADCVISGWGRTGTSNVLPQELQETDIGVIDNEDCQESMAGIAGATILDSHICIWDDAQEATSCSGDSGGPLMCRNATGDFQLAGITSWGIQSGGNCLLTYPSVYGRVSYFLDWIDENSKRKLEKQQL